MRFISVKNGENKRVKGNPMKLRITEEEAEGRSDDVVSSGYDTIITSY